MRDLIDSLRAEHDDLRTALAVLEAIARDVAAGGPFPSADCARVLRYLREFVVGVHFAKESATVLAGVTLHGGDADVETAGAVLRTQEDARSLLHSLVLFWEPQGELTGPERAGFAAAVHAFAAALRRGMLLEEQQLFAAARAIPGDDRLGWEQACGDAERGRRPASEWRRELGALRRRWR